MFIFNSSRPPRKGEILCLSQHGCKQLPPHPRRTVTLEDARHACSSVDFQRGIPATAPAAAERPKGLRAPLSRPGHSPALVSRPREAAGQQHPRRATKRGSGPGTTLVSQRQGLRQRLPAAATTKSRGPKPGRKSFARPPLWPWERAEAPQHTAPASPLCPPAPHPAALRIAPPAPHPYSPRHSILGAAPLQPQRGTSPY